MIEEGKDRPLKVIGILDAIVTFLAGTIGKVIVNG
jgi:hypothetical protein